MARTAKTQRLTALALRRYAEDETAKAPLHDGGGLYLRKRGRSLHWLLRLTDPATGVQQWQKAPIKLKGIWALGVRLQMGHRVRELALFNLGNDSKLRGCDLATLRVRDVCHGDQPATRTIVTQHKTQRPVQFEITPDTRDAL